MGKKVLIFFLFLLFSFSALCAKKESKNGPEKVVYVTGNKTFSTENLLKSSGVEFKKSQLRKDKLKMTEEECVEFSENIAVFYKREGFFDISVEKNQKEDSFEITIDEGKEYNVVSIKFSTSGKREELKEIIVESLPLIFLREGKRFRIEDYENTKSVLEKAFGNKGFPFAKVSEKAEVNLKEKSVAVSYLIDEGEKAVFGKTTFKGIIHTEEKILRKLLKYNEGDIYQVSKIEETKKALYSTNLFDVVTIKVKKLDENKTVPIKIILKEGRHRNFKLSFGYGADEKYRVQAGFETLRLFDKCVTTGFNLKKSSLEKSHEFHLIRPYAVSEYTGYFRAKKQTLHWVQTEFETTLLTAGLERKFSKINLSFDINYEIINRIKFTYPPPPIKDSALTPETLFFRLNLALDKTDNIIDPSKGHFIQGGVEGDKISNSTNFGKVWIDLRKYSSLKNGSVLAFKLKVASLISTAEIEKIPYPYRFFTGGQMRLRGYRFSSISPLSSNFSLEGGKGLTESSIEYRFSLRDHFKGVVFIESGRATRKSLPLETEDPIKSDIGFGLRYITPVGPVGMDIAFRLNKAEYSSSPFQIALFIGYSF